MNFQLVVTLTILVIAILLLLSDRLRPDLVALLVVVALGASGVLTPQEAFSGFSRSAVITIIGIFVLAEGLYRSGATEQVGNLLLKIGGKQETWLIVTVMLASAFLSLFMNNIAAASVLLPIASEVARKSGLNPGRLLMPLAFGTILGGMATLFTTTNIIASSLLRDQGLGGYGLLDFAPLGIPMVISGILYMSLWGRRWLPAQSPTQQLLSTSHDQEDLIKVYRLGERLVRGRVRPGSNLEGVSLESSRLRQTYHLNVLAIERNGKRILSPTPSTQLLKNDIIWMTAKAEDIASQALQADLEILPTLQAEENLESPDTVLVEAVLAPRSPLIGQTLRSVHFREKYAMNVLALWRAGRPIRTGVSDLPLQFGDALLLQGPRQRLPVLQSASELIVLSRELRKPSPGIGDRRPILALGILILSLLVAALNPSAVGEAVLGGALAMVLFGLLSMDQVYQAIDWKTVFLVAGMLPLGIAMKKSGAAILLAQSITTPLEQMGPMALLAGLVGLTILMTQAINGPVVSAIIVPIAIQSAQQVGVDPRAITMGIALASSMAFITPLGHPVNFLVMGPGGYRFLDYVKIGLPLTILLYLILLLLLPLFWPLS